MAEQVIKLGFLGYGKEDYGYIPKREFTKFTAEIDENDIWQALNYLNKGEKEIKTKDAQLIKKMFSNIAKEDGIIQETELKDYLERLAEKAKTKADPEILDAEELYEFCEENKIVKKKSKFRKFLEKVFGNRKKVHEKTVMHKFVDALVTANDVIVSAEEIMAQWKAEEEAEIAARTSYDKNGNRVYTDDDGYKIVYDKDDPDKSVTYDPQGRVFEKKYRDGNAIITDRNYYTSDKKNAKAEKYELIEHGNGHYEEIFYDVNGLRKSYYSHTKDCGIQIYYDEKGREEQGYSSENGIITERFTSEYYKNGNIRRCETKYYDYIWGRLTATEVELFDEDGNLTDRYIKKPESRYY